MAYVVVALDGGQATIAVGPLTTRQQAEAYRRVLAIDSTGEAWTVVPCAAVNRILAGAEPSPQQ